VSKPEQARLFELKRFSPARLGVILILPASSTRSFMVASALGRSMRRDSTYQPLRHGQDVIGVSVGKKQRTHIRAMLGIKPREWRRLVSEWVKLGAAHRCSRDELALFIEPLEPVCPICKADIELEAAVSLPPKRQYHYRKAAEVLPHFVPDSGDAYGMKRGM
jgi:hypothetical protein